MPLFSSQRSVNGVFSARKKSGGILPFLTRQVITTGYVAAGYKDSVAWRNVNKYANATDTATNLGDLLQESANYTSGAHNKDIAFIWATNGTGNQGVGAFASVSNFNMRNDTTATKPGNTSYTVDDSATLIRTNVDGTYNASYQTIGQGAAVWQKWNLTTETNAGSISSGITQGQTGSGHFEENHGYVWGDANTAAQSRKFVFATETESTPGAAPAFHGQQKGMPSKLGFGFGGNEGTYGSGRYFRKWNYTTEVTVATPQKMVWWCGEENFTMGQDAGYMLGHYSDTTGGNASATGQVNDIGKYTYATDSGGRITSTSLGGTQSGTGSSAGSPIGGRSSGHGYWRN